MITSDIYIIVNIGFNTIRIIIFYTRSSYYIAEVSIFIVAYQENIAIT